MLTRIVQLESGAMVALFRITKVPPVTAVKEAEAQQPLRVEETGLAMKTLAGRSSVSET
jgi:hypothetical protein